MLDNGNTEIRDASHLWGKDVFQTTDMIIKEQADKGTRVACIGPAGENLVKFANIMNEKHRAAGRGGQGAVLGSKKVKAIAVRGEKKPAIANKMAAPTCPAGKNSPLAAMNPAGIISISLGNGINELSTLMNTNTSNGPHVIPSTAISSKNGIK